MDQFRPVWMSMLLVVCAMQNGCVKPQATFVPDPIPKHRAIEIVNANIDRIRATLRAVGSLDGYATDSKGKRKTYHLDATLFYLAPSYVRLDLKSFATRQFLLGSNTEESWYYDKNNDAYYCAAHGEENDGAVDFPLRPDQIVEAMGLSRVADGVGGGETIHCVQRIESTMQQLLFLVYGSDGQLRLEKEYWLDRYPPRLVRRVIFRDANGDIELQSDLSEYRAHAPGGPLLPHEMTARWPGAGAGITFHVSKWRSFDQVGPDSVQFAKPIDCR